MGDAGSFRPVPGGFRNAIDLVKLIREEHGDYFCVAVAGYPEVHNEAWNSSCLPPSEQAAKLDLERLKQKVDAGADFVLTQFVYDAKLFLKFEKVSLIKLLPAFQLVFCGRQCSFWRVCRSVFLSSHDDISCLSVIRTVIRSESIAPSCLGT